MNRVLRIVLVIAACVLAVVVSLVAWAYHRISTYDSARSRVISRYRSEFERCVHSRASVSNCSHTVYSDCTEDTFWRTDSPFFPLTADPLDYSSTYCEFPQP